METKDRKRVGILKEGTASPLTINYRRSGGAQKAFQRVQDTAD